MWNNNLVFAMLRFKPMTACTWVSSHNHWTRAPVQFFAPIKQDSQNHKLSILSSPFSERNLRHKISYKIWPVMQLLRYKYIWYFKASVLLDEKEYISQKTRPCNSKSLPATA